MKNSKIKNDIILVLALLAIAGAAFAVLQLTKRPGGEAVITVDGEIAAILPLTKDTAYEVEQKGIGTNTVTVSTGEVCVSFADCPDKICVKQGNIRYNGESIVCLPHKLIVTVRGGESNTDAVAR
ncbi:MAG: NusG domain II-containing protein [Oscillospiraceae bacterium]|nr:NusG domain II-containing protein [Oscillospiraceae bacterium]